MININTKHGEIKVFTDNIEESAMAQLVEIGNSPLGENSKIRVMPDVHAGAGCVIGLTRTIDRKVSPNEVGVDIGCGMLVVKLANKSIDLKKLDGVIRDKIPSGFNVNKVANGFSDMLYLDRLHCAKEVNIERAKLSIGTLGGGNHFIEINKDSFDNFYLVIHTGSRNLGKQVAEYYQNLGYKTLCDLNESKVDLIKKLTKEGKQSEIQNEINKIDTPKINKSLSYIEGVNLDKYLYDIEIVQQFANFNRRAIAETILTEMGLLDVKYFTTIHNYIDTKSMILRKGSVSARDGEELIIPMNMRDGSLLCIGRGNPDWNYSAPHGAGRIMSRSKAKELVTIEEFEKSMEGIYTTSVDISTIDESPMAYKPMKEIIENIHETVAIKDVIVPVYNFKAGGN